jgi:hypothetical protein
MNLSQQNTPYIIFIALWSERSSVDTCVKLAQVNFIMNNDAYL